VTAPGAQRGDQRRILLTLRSARLTVAEWDEVRLALAVEPLDWLVISRLTFAAKVRQGRRGPAPALGGKGSPAALVVCAVLSALVLGGAAAALGGGLIYVPAAIPVLTVMAVLGARAWSSAQERRGRGAGAPGDGDGRQGIPADVRDRVEAELWPPGLA
jgi:hypothetical protein